jgi:hypothetical protein
MVGRWIQRRRLEECRRDLELGVRGRRTIASVAGRWGFLSATRFSRVFRAAYGMSPSEWRDGAGPEGRTPTRQGASSDHSGFGIGAPRPRRDPNDRPVRTAGGSTRRRRTTGGR